MTDRPPCSYNVGMKKKIMIIFGTRPELIKVAPIILDLQQHPDRFELFLLATAQHREMLDQMLEIFHITPHRDLNVMVPNQTLATLSSNVLNKVTEIFLEVRPDLVMIQGDTTTAMVSALAAFYLRIPSAHIEAGLRTGDTANPFPEEINRKIIGTLASYHFPPTARAAANLEREGIPHENILLTGNSVVDALHIIAPGLDRVELPFRPTPGRRMILVTAHRRENFGEPMENICRAILSIRDRHADVELVYPVHPNPNVREKTDRLLRGQERIHLLQPLNYVEFLAMMKQACLLLTDSGGVQEEAPTFRKPVLVMRLVTERPEGVEAGVSRIVGTDERRIVAEVSRLLDDPAAYAEMSGGANPYGDGHTAERIRRFLLEKLF